ncbi:uncharacterized protein LOC106080562 [Stomoxys calcitrans]|uniref:uncharacterized protein LOC106080562 n=1 Tax=Stomoxys calcitrans TaxID=35570 RepID=UPI0027E316B6|nr:uncharacterized protein LOC106080562 [Stomoxys calcitrans]
MSLLYVKSLVLVLILFPIKCKSFKNDILKSEGNGEISQYQIEAWLKKPIEHIPYLHLMLRSSLYHHDVENPYTKWFLQQTFIPLILSIYEIRSNETPIGQMSEEPNNYIIMSSMKDLRQTSLHFAQRSGIYFFIIDEDDEVDIQYLRNTCHDLWINFQIYKNLLLTKSGIFTYDPFAINDNGVYGKIIRYTGEESMERTIFFNMRGYPLRVQIFRSVYSKPMLDEVTKKVKYVYGVDGRVADVLQERLNFTMNFLDPDPDYFGERAPNGTYNGAIGSIINNELDLCLSGFFVKDYMVPELEFSVAAYDDMLCIYTPKASKIPQSILPILSVDYTLWLGFIVTAFVCSLIWIVLRCLNLQLNISHDHVNETVGAQAELKKSYKWQFIRILIDTWVVWVRVNVTHFPPFNSEKIFIATLCLMSVIFGAIFDSSLATVYIHPMYYKDMHTMADLDKSGLHVIYKYSSMGDDLFFSETSPLFASLNKKLSHLKDLDADVLKDVAEHGGKAGVSRYTTLTLEYLRYIINKQVWVIPECPKYYTISYVWHKHAPWDDTINQLLLRMQNGGLFTKFIRQMQTDVDITISSQINIKLNEGFKVLTVEDLQLAFYVILVGSFMAFISFWVETLSKRRHPRISTLK